MVAQHKYWLFMLEVLVKSQYTLDITQAECWCLGYPTSAGGV